MKKYILLTLMLLMMLSCKKDTKASKDTSVYPEKSINDGWVSLFDGKSFKGWHTYLRDTIGDEWQIKEGAMVYTPDPEKSQGMNNLITDKKYNSFELSMEWKISVDGNSGVFYGILEDEKYVVPYLTAPEIQIRDYTNIPEFNDNKQMSGAIFGIIGPKKEYVKKAGEWNHFLIKINYLTNEGSVALNGHEIINFPIYGKEWDEMVASSNFKDWEGFGIHKSGHIGLQDHAHEVWFKNLKIREIE